MKFILLTKSNTFIIGPVATLLGYIMDAIFKFTNWFGICNIGLGIIIFTIITKLVMLPLNISQQKFSKLNAIMNPEIMAIQRKYKDKKDQESMMKQNQEMQDLYKRYGVKPASGCLQLLIQFPILFGLYKVVYNIPAYVESIRAMYMDIVVKLQSVAGYELNQKLIDLAEKNNVKAADLLTDNKLIDMMYAFDANEWTAFQDIFPNINISASVAEIEKANSFLGLSLYNSPMEYVSHFGNYGIGTVIIAVLIPILAGALQWISVKFLNPSAPDTKKELGKEQEESPMAQSMKMMTNVMPLMSVFFCFTFPTCIGVYWVVSSLAMIVVQYFVNRYMQTMDINAMISKNLEKVNKKRAKMGLPPQKMSNVTRKSVTLEEMEREEKEEQRKMAERRKQIKDNTELYKNTTAKPGSLAAKAGMVKQYNDRNNKK